ncbi:insulinase family protein [Pikeienuella piscinae]|uniref:Insulinase family protein n=1 Tax=Pikeienuella piscinae TaxID=2748098 RepID=A0A7L5BYV6_9RHOB|nr:pitrilysin family protein [Pikeienuella piscinae]QIE56922.1 insulinase family protein [Pikeienuella piscinae]
MTPRAPVLLATILTLLALPALAASKVSTFTLENGMQGVVIEDHRAPVVTQMVWYKVGSADETSGNSGIAHFLEHLMFKGTDKIPEGAFSKIVAENGGQDNAFTSYDYTAYFQRIAADRLDLVMGMEADRMRNLRLTDALVLPERDVILEERNQRTENNPGSLFREQMDAALYLNHPYGRPVIGWRSEMAELTLQDALEFYAAHYAPDNAILVVAGDVEPSAVEALAKAHFGPIPAAGVEPRRRPQEPPQLAPRRLEMADARVRQPYVIRTYLTPSRRSGGDEDAAALSILAEVLGGGGVTSRLAKKLQLEDRIAISSGASYNGSGLDYGEFSVYGVPAEGVALDDIETGFDAVMAELAETGPTDAELDRARVMIRASEIYAQDSQQGLAQRYGAGLATGLTVERIEAWPDILAGVSADDVKRAATMLRLEASVTGRLVEAKETTQ